MGDKKKSRFSLHIFVWLFIFALGFGAGFVVRDRQQHEKVQAAVDEALNRTHRASGELGRGVGAAVNELEGQKKEKKE